MPRVVRRATPFSSSGDGGGRGQNSARRSLPASLARKPVLRRRSSGLARSTRRARQVSTTTDVACVQRPASDDEGVAHCGQPPPAPPPQRADDLRHLPVARASSAPTLTRQRDDAAAQGPVRGVKSLSTSPDCSTGRRFRLRTLPAGEPGLATRHSCLAEGAACDTNGERARGREDDGHPVRPRGALVPEIVGAVLLLPCLRPSWTTQLAPSKQR